MVTGGGGHERPRRADVERALGRVGAYVGRDLHGGDASDVGELVRLLADYPERHLGSIAGLADKSIAWHRRALGRRRAAIAAELSPTTRAALPPVPLPDAPGIRLLATVQEICAEGDAMEHCVAEYARAAVAGRGFLFHVERDGRSATVLVDERGRVGEASGRRNRDNAAATWGSEELGRWGETFPEPPRPGAGDVNAGGDRMPPPAAAAGTDDAGATMPADTEPADEADDWGEA